MYDSGGNGWNGSNWSLTNAFSQTLDMGTLPTGGSGQHVFAIGVPPSQCLGLGPMTPGDCATALHVCDDLSFHMMPNGIGMQEEVFPTGSFSNPNYTLNDGLLSPWGTDNWGCLRIDEHHSTWMLVNILMGGSLEFTIGHGMQSSYYDWIMYAHGPTTCADVAANAVAPVRCNWNDVPWGGTGLRSSLPPGGDINNYEPPLNVVAGQQYLICFSNYNGATATVPVVFSGTAVVGCEPVVLPVELLSFTAEREAADVRLRWVTAAEANTQRFEVEKSADREVWWMLGAVPAAGNSQHELHYSLLDADPLQGTNYYRLRTVDLDGTGGLSPVVAVRTEDARPLHPNPSDGTLWIEQEGEVLLLDATGREAVYHVQTSSGPLRRIMIPTAGVYLLRIGQGADIRQERIVVH
jgi:hypothetical protein